MALHLVALLGVERARAQQDVVGERDLADVVHRARDADRLDVEAELAGQHRAIGAHPLGVPAGLLVAVLDRAGQAPHGLLAGELQARRGALQRRCARAHDLLERLALGAVLDLELAALESAFLTAISTSLAVNGLMM